MNDNRKNNKKRKESGKGKGSYGGGRKGDNKRSGSRSDSTVAISSPRGRFDLDARNHIEWWNKSPIFEDATRISYNRYPGYVHGSNVYFKSDSDVDAISNMPDVYSMPGVLRINYHPVLGVSNDRQSPLNRSFTTLYAEMVAHTNSGKLGFTQASIAFLTCAAASIVTNIAHASKCLKLRRIWNNENAYLPVTLLEACGLSNYSEAQWETWRVQLNTMIDEFNSLQIPKYVSMLDRAFQIAHGVYSDEDDIKGQFAVFVPASYSVYEDINNRTVYKELAADPADPLHLSAIREQLDALRSTADLGDIMGAYRRAFDKGDTMFFDIVKPDEVTIPVKDKTMAYQINNMRSAEVLLPSLNLYEDVVKDVLLCQPKISINGLGSPNPHWSDNIILNSYDGTWDSEFIMEATRLVFRCEDTNNSMSGFRVLSCGTELVSGFALYYAKLDEKHQYTVEKIAMNQYPTATVDADNFVSVVNRIHRNMGLISKFRNHPLIYPVMIDITNNKDYTSIPMGDLYRWSVIDGEQLDQINLAALQSAYLVNIPTKW